MCSLVLISAFEGGPEVREDESEEYKSLNNTGRKETVEEGRIMLWR